MDIVKANASFPRCILDHDASLWHTWGWNPDHRTTTKCLHNMVSYQTYQKETQAEYPNMTEPISLLTPLLLFVFGLFFFLQMVVFCLVYLICVLYSDPLFYILSWSVIHIYSFSYNPCIKTSKCVTLGSSLGWVLKHPNSCLASSPESVKVTAHATGTKWTLFLL